MSELGEGDVLMKVCVEAVDHTPKLPWRVDTLIENRVGYAAATERRWYSLFAQSWVCFGVQSGGRIAALPIPT
jgi:hypothetical protein